MSLLGDYGVSSSGSGGGGGGGLTTAYEVDFAALATQPIAGDGAVVIDGHNWIFANFANTASAGVVNGTGLQITPALGGNIWTVGIYTAPAIYAPLTDFGIEVSEVLKVRMMVRYVANGLDATNEFFRICISTPPVVATEHISWGINKAFPVAVGALTFSDYIEANGVGGGGVNDTANLTDDVMGVSVSNLFSMETFTGVYAGGFPSSFRRRSIRTLPANTSIVTPDNNSDFHTVFSPSNNGGNGFQMIIQNMRLEYWT